MASPQSDPGHSLLRRRLTGWSGIGYLVFATGALLGTWLAGRAWKPESDENPLAVLVIVWVIAGITHMSVPRFWPACGIAALGSALGYVVFAIVFTPNPFLNEMFGAGIISVGLFGFVLSVLMGIPVRQYRRSRTRAEARGSDPS